MVYRIGLSKVQYSGATKKSALYTKDGTRRNDSFNQILLGKTVTNGRVRFSIIQRIVIMQTLTPKNQILHCQNPECPISLDIQKEMGITMFDIDHIDDDHNNNSLKNFQILCCFCNQMKNRRRK